MRVCYDYASAISHLMQRARKGRPNLMVCVSAIIEEYVDFTDCDEKRPPKSWISRLSNEEVPPKRREMRC